MARGLCFQPRRLRLAAAMFLVLVPRLGAADDTSPGAVTGSQRPRTPLTLAIDKAKVDLVGHQLELTASHPLVKATLHVVGDSGAVLADVERILTAHPAGAPLVLEWSPASDEAVARIEVFVYDDAGYYKGVALTPWSVAIPHEEVVFATDSAAIADTERPKLEATFGKVTEALARHPQIQGVRLFIAGHTDTVGDAEYNLRLSRQRAQAIARWFRQRGLRVPIAWQGFGESSPLVKTADNVDEPRNRRVDYILSADEPTYRSSGLRASWNGVP